jgi:hypothetical protein
MFHESDLTIGPPVSIAHFIRALQECRVKGWVGSEAAQPGEGYANRLSILPSNPADQYKNDIMQDAASHHKKSFLI